MSDVLVLGATGSVGSRVTRRLRERGIAVRAASRHGGTRFDWADARTWEPALRGARAVFVLAPDGVPVASDFVALAAMRAQRLVLLSSRAIDTMNDQRLLAAERDVRHSGAEWTVVRSDWFDQNFDEGPFREAVLAGEVSVPLGDTKQGFVDLDDVADVAVQALTADGHAGETYEVTGPRALSFGEACAVLGAVTGQQLSYVGDPDDYRRTQIEQGRPAAEVDAEIAVYGALRELGDAAALDTVPRVTGHPARTFEQYAASAARAGRWSDRRVGS